LTTGTASVPPVGVVDVGGGHVAAGVVEGGALVDEQRSALDSDAGLEALLPALTAPPSLVSHRRAASGRPAAQEWVVALPGPFDYATGSGDFSGVEKFGALAGVDLRGAFATALAVPPASVRFVNDAVAYAVGEWASGAGRRAARMICLTLGTGVGSAFLADGRHVASGEDVPQDGAVHTLTIDGRPLEETVSTPALRARFRHLRGGDLTVEQICSLARRGDDDASEVVSTAFVALGLALSPWATRFGTSTVVVGGGVSRSWDVVGPPLTRGLLDAAGRGGAAQPTVVPASLGDSAPLLGAAAWART
jgi:glucokinase